MPDDRFQDEPDRPAPRDEERPRRPRREIDEEEDERPRRRSRRYEDDDSGGMNALIPYKNPKALIAYYCGVFALIPCIGVLLGTLSIVFGILGLKYRAQHETAGGTGHAWAGIILGSLVLLGHLVLVGFAVVAANMK